MTFFAGALKGGLPSTASTLEEEFPKPMSAFPPSTATTFAMPPPGATETVDPGKFFWINSAIAPPRGYHDPPIGPVIILISTFSWPMPKKGQIRKKIIPNPKHKQTILFIFIAILLYLGLNVD